MEDDNLDELIENIETKISEVSKFKTHKQRKEFLGEIKTMIKSYFNSAKNKSSHGVSEIHTNKISEAITRPNNTPSKGHAVMTESKSSSGDDVRNAYNAKIENERRGFRSW